VKSDPLLYERFKRFIRFKTKSNGTGQKIPGPEKENQPHISKPAHGSTLKLPEWQQIAEFVYTRSLTLPNPYKDQKNEPLFSAKYGSLKSTLCFYDTETTGLSGGAGNVVFLLGLGWINKQELLFEQYFLADFPGEQEYLSLLCAKLHDDHTYVSYNGSAFDRHILRTRYIMHGMQKSLPQQLDLLYPARRLWKPLIGPCSLHHVEEQVLNITRERDVPGSEIPALYFEYLCTGNPVHLELVFSHNKQDILSLIHLYFKLQHIFSSPLCAQDVDNSALGSMLLEQQHPQAEALLKKACDRGDPRCTHILSMHYKKQESWGEALKLWQGLYTRNKNISAGLELAKYWEHKKRQYRKALSLVEELLVSAPPHPLQIRKALQHRCKRLRHKIEEIAKLKIY